MLVAPIIFQMSGCTHKKPQWKGTVLIFHEGGRPATGAGLAASSTWRVLVDASLGTGCEAGGSSPPENGPLADNRGGEECRGSDTGGVRGGAKTKTEADAMADVEA